MRWASQKTHEEIPKKKIQKKLKKLKKGIDKKNQMCYTNKVAG